MALQAVKKISPALLVGVLIAAGFLVFMCTFSVRFTEAAVRTRFGAADADSVITEPGLHWRIPLLDSVTTYDTRARVLRAGSETQQTADGQQVVIEAFVFWRVVDPLKFYQRFSSKGAAEDAHYRAAERALTPMLRSAMAQVGGYTQDELFRASEQASGGSAISRLEEAILARLGGGGEEPGLGELGVGVDLVGIQSILPPQKVSGEIFGSMKAARDAEAEYAKNVGSAEARAITAKAKTDEERILAFARGRAAQIRLQGDKEAAEFLETLGQEPDLAIILRQMQFLTETYGKHSTIVLPINDMPYMDVLSPGYLKGRQAQDTPDAEPGR